jgi:hypothetical protein
VFERERTITEKTLGVVSEGLLSPTSGVRLAIPSTAFIELFDLWWDNEEFSAQVYSEVFIPLRDAEHVSIYGVTCETLEALSSIQGGLAEHDIHDKLILATAIELEVTLVTSDAKLIKYARSTCDLSVCA